jgi:two-component sensor histidine kinase
MRECAIENPTTVYRLDATGLWGEVVRQKRPIVVNDYDAPSPFKRGCPEGHVALATFMSVPVLREGRVVAVAGVANRPGGYGDGDVMELTLLMDACWQVVGRMNAEQDVLRSLHEKEILLKEIHHRVKNNMQVISSLLFLQMQYVSNESDRVLFAESQKRIQAMALVHEELYGARDLSSVDMREYVPRLVGRVTGGSAVPVEARCRVDEVRLPVTSSIPCGLLLNELVMNAVKHAFKARHRGLLMVNLTRENGNLLLCVEDDGPGLPQGFSMAESGTLGMTLVSSLAAQLGGRVWAENRNPGARFCLGFPSTEA